MTAPRWQLEALKAAWAGAKSWRDAADRYNAATGVRPPKSAESIQLKCRSLGMAASWEVDRPGRGRDADLREAVESAVGWDQVAELYNAATGESRSMEALKSRAYDMGLKLANRKKPGPAEGTNGKFDADGAMLRAQRIRLYKECHAIKGRKMTAKDMDEALDTDPTGWPDPPPPGDEDCPATGRHPRVYRMRLPRGRVS